MSISNVVGEIYPSNLFTWDKEKNAFFTDISQVRGCLRTLFRDDMAVGFGIRSQKTGNTAYFTLTKIDRDADGDITYWRFDVHENNTNPALDNVKVFVFNT